MHIQFRALTSTAKRPSPKNKHNWRNQSFVNKRFESEGANRFKMEDRQTQASNGDIYTPDSAGLGSHDLYLNLTRLVSGNESVNPVLTQKYIDRAIDLSRDNKISSKDFSLLLHLTVKLPIPTDPLLRELRRKVQKNHKFTNQMVPTDIAIIFNSLTKLTKKDTSLTGICRDIVRRLSDEIPIKISLFENHQLAQVLHALSTLEIRDPVIIIEIVREIELARDLDSFNSQSVVMIATALSRQTPLKQGQDTTDVVAGIWESIMIRACSIPRSEMQANWPDVLLTAVAFGGVGKDQIYADFIQKMVTETCHQFAVQKIGKSRIAKAIDALIRMQVNGEQIHRLRRLSHLSS